MGARTTGTELEKDCTAKNIKSVKINFRASTSVKPNLASTRAGDRIEFLDIKDALEGGIPGEDEEDPGTGGGGSGDPNA